MPATKLIRWSLNAASDNFGIAFKTLTVRIKSEGIEPGEDNKFSTMDICRAVYGDLKGDLMRAQTRAQNEAADMTAVKKSNLLRDNIPADLVERVWSSVLIELRQRISYAEIPDKVKHDLSRDLMSIPVEEYFKDSKPVDIEEGDE